NELKQSLANKDETVHSIAHHTRIIRNQCSLIFYNRSRPHVHQNSFPTRRSSDLSSSGSSAPRCKRRAMVWKMDVCSSGSGSVVIDRKSTRLNSSHDQISYAVFCLKKKMNLDVLDVVGQQRIDEPSWPR